MANNFKDVVRKLRNRLLPLGYFDLAFFLFSAQELFVLFCAIIIFEILGIYGLLLDLATLLVAVIFERSIGKILVRIFRKPSALLFYLIFQISLFGLIGTVGIGLAKMPTQAIYGSLAFGLWASIVCSLQSYRVFVSFFEMRKMGLDFSKLNESFLQLSESFRTEHSVMEGYNVALYIIPLLYSSCENLFMTITIGNIIQSLLDSIDHSPNVGPVTKAKRTGLNVSFEEITVNDQRHSFDFEYFWRNIRSKHAHVTVLSRYGIEEPSQEIARKSVGLLCAFLKTYPTCVNRIENKRST